MKTAEVQPQVYQWLKTDRAGEYVYEDRIEQEDDMTFVKFTDGTQANVDLLGEVFIKVEDEDDGYIIEETVIEDLKKAKLQDGKTVEIPGVLHGQKKTVMKKKPPRKRRAKKVEPVANHKPTAVKEKLPELAIDPVVILLEKAKKERHSYEVELNVDVISKDLFSVVKNTFGDGEEKSLDYIVSLIDMDKLKDQLKEKLKEVYNG
jgi:hypothetical protein